MAQECFDLIYAAGLFDYLDDPTGRLLVRGLVHKLKPGGRLIVGNFTPDNRYRAFLSLITQWDILHKSETQLREWLADLDDIRVNVDYDDDGINAFLVAAR